MGLMQKFNEPNIITTSSDKLFNWARKNSLWPLQFGSCCAIEMMSTGMAHNDLDRFGAGFFTASPRQADVMIVSGTVSTKMAERITRLYEQMPEPKGSLRWAPAPRPVPRWLLRVDGGRPRDPGRRLRAGLSAETNPSSSGSWRRRSIGYSRPALVTEEGEILEYLPEREYTNISEGKAPRFENIRPLYLRLRARGHAARLPNGCRRIPKEVKKKLKEQEKAEKATTERGQRTALPKSPPTRRGQMPVALPEGDLNSRLGAVRPKRSRGEGNLVRLVRGAVLATAKERLGVCTSRLSRSWTESDLELTYELLDLRGGQVRVRTTLEGEEPVRSPGSTPPTGTSGRRTTCSAKHLDSTISTTIRC